MTNDGAITSPRYRVLMVEDDPFKEERLREALLNVHSTCAITVARTVQHAIGLLGGSAYDLIVLDMALPSHESRPGGAPAVSQPSGGVEILIELSSEGRGERVVIVTQYPDIEFDDKFYPLARFPSAFAKKAKVNLRSVIRFSMRGTDWRAHFEEAIR